MALSAKLERLKSEVPGCLSVVFGDLDTRTVLRASAEPGLRQEAHDRALAEAALLLGPEGASILAPAPASALIDDGAEEPLTRAIRVDHAGIRVMHRGGETGGDLLVLSLSVAGLAPPEPGASAPAASPLERQDTALRAISTACQAVLAGDA